MLSVNRRTLTITRRAREIIDLENARFARSVGLCCSSALSRRCENVSDFIYGRSEQRCQPYSLWNHEKWRADVERVDWFGGIVYRLATRFFKSVLSRAEVVLVVCGSQVSTSHLIEHRMTCGPVIFVSYELPDMKVAFRIGDATCENIENSQM